jgi:hypothetical protein
MQHVTKHGKLLYEKSLHKNLFANFKHIIKHWQIVDENQHCIPNNQSTIERFKSDHAKMTHTHHLCYIYIICIKKLFNYIFI